MNTKKIRNIILSIASLSLFILLAIGSVDEEETTKGGAKKNVSKSQNVKATKVEDKFLPGLQPVDVYLNLTKQGFSKKDTFSSEYGNSWVCKLSQAGIDYEVSIYSTDINKVESVQATAMIDVTRKQIIAVQQFLIFISSVPYDNAKPNEIASWIKQNFNNDKASTVIEKVKFTIYVPSKAVRMLRIEKNI